MLSTNEAGIPINSHEKIHVIPGRLHPVRPAGAGQKFAMEGFGFPLASI